jgi:UDPglucose--hexose-1-phosphate uridylyltransferase
MQKARQYHQTERRCVFCAILEEELEQSVRILEQNEHFVAFCPYASHTPFETRIYPKRHLASFTGISGEETAAFAAILRRTMARIHLCLGVPNYNYLIRSAPVGDGSHEYYHWYFVVLPRVTTPAGFEIGTGIFVNSIPPESAAAYLGDCDPDAARIHRKSLPS